MGEKVMAKTKMRFQGEPPLKTHKNQVQIL
jgi:hypothetical protein